MMVDGGANDPSAINHHPSTIIHHPLTIVHRGVQMSFDNDAEVERQIRRMSRRSLLWGAAAIGAGFTGWRWLITRRSEDDLPWPFRRVLEVNAEAAGDY